ncbi:putative Cytochrome P450 oxidoreductase [Pleurostoma richardsiae]|uniref:Cytochrome P450 oxidoreductase n=1 Tax=Pleurostoma richardsiae TaxID=41990 RepID=A0AA38RFE8_9PEZI|nr:putative Cytochrome P450 oxidoreductase [Pleurostoma richardsiae]
MALPVSPAALAVVITIGFIIYQLLQVGRRPKGLPPGPPTLPIVGNLHQLPKEDVHVKFREWADQYGEIYSVMLGNQRMVVLNSPQVVKDLIDQRSNNYSSRPDMYVGQTLISGGYRLVLMQYDDGWRLARKMIHNLLNIKTAVEYIPYQELELRNMLADMVKKPNAYHDHVRRYSTSLITSIAFGWRSLAFNDPDVKAIYEGFEEFAVASNVSASMLDYFPILRLMPDWMNPSKRRGKALHQAELKLYKSYMNRVRERNEKGIKSKNFCDTMFKLQEKHGFSDDWASYVSGTLLEAGSDTTASIFLSFAVAMINFPEVQKKAQQEIDRVIGADRLPTMADEMSLQYIRGVVKESLRFLPSSILGIVPHATTSDDTYRDYHFPAKTGMMINVWALNNNPERYPDPRRFDPDRYKDDFLRAQESATLNDVSKRDHFTFGAGRRVCPGLNIAERSLFLGIAYMLWAFSFEHAVDEKGEKIPVSTEAVTQGIVCRPKPFPLKMVRRDPKRIAMVTQAWDNAKELLSRYPEGIRSTQYADDWKEFTLNEKFI